MNVIKRVWHLFCDSRFIQWRATRWINVWLSWHPYIGGCFDVFVEFIPWHNADPDDERDFDFNAEVKAGLSLLWFDFSVTIPNDDWPDEPPRPPRHCKYCGNETEPMITDRCTGCDKPTAACRCETKDGC